MILPPPHRFAFPDNRQGMMREMDRCLAKEISRTRTSDVATPTKDEIAPVDKGDSPKTGDSSKK